MDCTEYPSVLCNNTAGAFSAAGAEAGRGRRGTVDEEGSEGGGLLEVQPPEHVSLI